VEWGFEDYYPEQLPKIRDGRSTSTVPTGLAPVEWGFEDY